MPRHPIGDRAMTDAERQRRRREKLRQERPAPDEATRVRQLEAEVARLRSRIAELERLTEASPPVQSAAPEDPAAKMRRLHEEMLRENAQWGGRPRARVVGDIGRLLARKGALSDDNPVTETIINVMLKYVGDQTNIELGIPRRVYRRVLADLSPDCAPGNEAAFIAFKARDAKKDNGKPNLRSIVLADDKVRTMADERRKRQERSDRAKAAATARRRKG